MGFYYEVYNAQAYKFNNSTRNISAIGEHLSELFVTFVLRCACAQIPLCQSFLVKILTPPLDWSAPISYMVRIFWRSVGICHVILTFDPTCSVSAVTGSLHSTSCNSPVRRQPRRQPINTKTTRRCKRSGVAKRMSYQGWKNYDFKKIKNRIFKNYLWFLRRSSDFCYISWNQCKKKLLSL